MAEAETTISRGLIWLRALTGGEGTVAGGPASVRYAEAPLGDGPACFLAVVPDAGGRFPRARHGEVGLLEAWTLAKLVGDVVAADEGRVRRPIVAVVDVRGQAYGRLEELLGIHQACAAAVDAYASARLAGHPLIALLVGRAMSGAFLAHGYQANRILALEDPGVLVHAMGKQAAARVTRRSVAELEELGNTVLPMSYDIRNLSRLGLVHRLISGIDPGVPSAADVARVATELAVAVAEVRAGGGGLDLRLENDAARKTRAASLEVRRRMAEQWAGDGAGA